MSTIGRYDRTPRYIVRPEAGLYIGQFTCFAHAFKHWKRLPNNEDWFIVTTDRAKAIMTALGAPRYLKFDEPCSWTLWVDSVMLRGNTWGAGH